MAQATTQRIAGTPKCGVDTASCSTRTAKASQPGAVALHGQALNSLSRCQHELLKPVTDYSQALACLDLARQNVLGLAAAESAAVN